MPTTEDDTKEIIEENQSVKVVGNEILFTETLIRIMHSNLFYSSRNLKLSC